MTTPPDPTDYADHMEAIAKMYDAKAFGILGLIRLTLIAADFEVTEPYQMWDDEYRWAMVAREAGTTDDQHAADLTIEIAEQVAYEGDTAPWGLNFGLDIVRLDGLLIGGYQPYNFTEWCWVDSTDAKAVADRWEEFEIADTTEISGLLRAHWGDK